jgi:hypothetical protein
MRARLSYSSSSAHACSVLSYSSSGRPRVPRSLERSRARGGGHNLPHSIYCSNCFPLFLVARRRPCQRKTTTDHEGRKTTTDGDGQRHHRRWSGCCRGGRRGDRVHGRRGGLTDLDSLHNKNGPSRRAQNICPVWLQSSRKQGLIGLRRILACMSPLVSVLFVAFFPEATAVVAIRAVCSGSGGLLHRCFRSPTNFAVFPQHQPPSSPWSKAVDTVGDLRSLQPAHAATPGQTITPTGLAVQNIPPFMRNFVVAGSVKGDWLDSGTTPASRGWAVKCWGGRPTQPLRPDIEAEIYKGGKGLSGFFIFPFSHFRV